MVAPGAGARRNTPSSEIDFPAANFRILPGFLNAATGYTGVLYWGVNYWNRNPWRDAVYAEPCCYPGEGALIYPGTPRRRTRADPTLRLAWIREGIEDYGYVALLRQLNASGVRRLLKPAAAD